MKCEARALPVRVWRSARYTRLPPRLFLRAGPLTLWREEGDLCSITLGDREIVRRVYVAVRDRNWGTIAPRYSNITQESGDRSFRVSFDAENTKGPVSLSWRGVIAGGADGTIRYTMEGRAGSTFLKNRIGFCVLHPDSAAGAACRILHADGSEERSAFPRSISPHQPFLDLRALCHEVFPGVWAEVGFEGDVFETEDQRNWTDASFKTYCTPLRLPFPVEISAGTRISQAVTVGVAGVQGAPAVGHAKGSGRRRAAEISYAADPGGPDRPLPRMGLGTASHGAPLSARELSLLSRLAIDHLRVDLDLSSAEAHHALVQAAQEAAALCATLEVALFLSEAAERELEGLRNLISGLPCGIARWLVFKTGESSTAEKWVALARRALVASAPGACLSAGTNAYFAELNRGMPPGVSADALVYSINPQIHAFDDTSVMETLATQSATVECARAIGGGRPVVVSPVTLKPRFNAVATGPLPPVPPGELPPQVDPRQMSLFAAAWTLGSLTRLAGSGAESATYYETTGWRGVLETDAGSPVPAERFPSLPGSVFPLYHVLADYGELRTGRLKEGRSSCPGALAGLSVSSAGRPVTLLANLTPRPLSAMVKAAGSMAHVRSLDESTVEEACLHASGFREMAARPASVIDGALCIKLLPYGVYRINWEA